jgi:plastocyanin
MRPAATLTLLAGLSLAAPCLALTVTVHDRGAPAADVVVALDPLDAPAPASSDRAIVDQIDRQFAPHISVIRTGTLVDFPNKDQIRHQVYSFSPTKPFTLKLYAGRSAPPVLFDRPGLVVLGCNIHDRMVAFVAVVDTPYFGRTGADGQLQLNVPPGHYRLRVWHPELEHPVAPQQLTLPGDGKPLLIDVTRSTVPTNVSAWVE